MLGVTLSRKWQTKGERAVTHVAAVDVPLETILQTTGHSVDEQAGYSFVINRDYLVIDPGGASTDEGVRTATQLELDIIAGWRESGSRVDMPFVVASEGQRWWADLRTVSNDAARLWLAVAVPDSSFGEELRGRQHLVALIILGVLMVGVLVTILATQAQGDLVRLSILVIILAGIYLISWPTLFAADKIVGRLGESRMHVITRMLGLILAALAVQYVLNGLAGFYDSLISP